MTSSGPSFTDITGAYLSSLSGRAPPSAHTAVLQMMSKLGDIAAACDSQDSHKWSAFERGELKSLVGELAVSLCGLGAALEIDVGDAAAAAARERCANASSVRRDTKRNTLRPEDAPSSAPAAVQPPQTRTAAAPQPTVALAQTPSHLRPPPLTNGTATAAAPRPAAVAPSDELSRWQSATTTQRANAEPLLLSPRTSNAFFPELDRIAAKFRGGALSRGEFDALSMTWCVIDDSGQVVDLIGGGRHRHVAFDEFLDYFNRANGFRTAPVKQGGAQNIETPIKQQQTVIPRLNLGLATASSGPDSDDNVGGLGAAEMSLMSPTARPAAVPGYEVHRIHVGGAARMEKDRAHFSPDHFKGGLLSPYQAMAYLDVEFPANQTSLPPPATGVTLAMPAAPLRTLPPAVMSSVAAGPSSAPPLSQASQGDSAAAGSPPRAAVVTEAQAADFWARHGMIEAEEATGNAIAALGLTFTMPLKGRMAPLTTNGEYISVTAANAQEFLALVREQQDFLAGKLRRVDSVKTIMTPDAPLYNHRVESLKYGHDRWQNNATQITAPAPPARKAFHVDYDERALGDVLPAALQRKPLPPNVPSAAHYLEFILTNPEAFRDVFAAVTRDRSMLDRLQVTYCVPDPDALLSPHFAATLPPGSRPRCGATDLIPQGRHVRVHPADFDRYYQLVREAANRLPPSVAPGF